MPHRGELLQDVGVGGGAGLGLLLHRKLQLVEEHRGQLARRIDVEIGPRDPGDSLFQPAQIPAQLLAQPGEDRAIDVDAFPLHIHQRLHQRHLDVPEQLIHLDFEQSGRESVVECEDAGAVVATIFGCRGDRDFGEGDFPLPLPHQLLPDLQGTAEVLEAEGIDRVGTTAGIQHEVGEHGVEDHAG